MNNPAAVHLLMLQTWYAVWGVYTNCLMNCATSFLHAIPANKS